MPAVVRCFEKQDRDQLTELVNLHVASVIPGVVLSVNTVLSQLEREAGESVVDPWVAERRCLVAERDHRLVAATLLHRFRRDADVGADYRGIGNLRWILCRIDAVSDGQALLAAALQQMRRWQVAEIGADCSLPAPGCYGIPDTMPHLRALLTGADFSGPSRQEVVLVARCEDLLDHELPGASIVRTVGTLGTRFNLSIQGDARGYIEVGPRADLARSSVATQWADVGNRILPEGADPAAIIPALLSAAASWLLLGGVTRLIDYWAVDVDSRNDLATLQRAGFQTLVHNERGFRRIQ